MRSVILAALLLAFCCMLAKCVMGAECQIAWDRAPVAENVTSWRVYCGIGLLATVSQPTVTVILPDAPCTIAVVAVNSSGLTSRPATLKLVYITDQDTVDLLAWQTLRSYYHEFLPGRRFYRTKIETPL